MVLFKCRVAVLEHFRLETFVQNRISLPCSEGNGSPVRSAIPDALITLQHLKG